MCKGIILVFSCADYGCPTGQQKRIIDLCNGAITLKPAADAFKGVACRKPFTSSTLKVNYETPCPDCCRDEIDELEPEDLPGFPVEVDDDDNDHETGSASGQSTTSTTSFHDEKLRRMKALPNPRSPTMRKRRARQPSPRDWQNIGGQYIKRNRRKHSLLKHSVKASDIPDPPKSPSDMSDDEAAATGWGLSAAASTASPYYHSDRMPRAPEREAPSDEYEWDGFEWVHCYKPLSPGYHPLALPGTTARASRDGTPSSSSSSSAFVPAGPGFASLATSSSYDSYTAPAAETGETELSGDVWGEDLEEAAEEEPAAEDVEDPDVFEDNFGARWDNAYDPALADEAAIDPEILALDSAPSAERATTPEDFAAADLYSASIEEALTQDLDDEAEDSDPSLLPDAESDEDYSDSDAEDVEMDDAELADGVRVATRRQPAGFNARNPIRDTVAKRGGESGR